MTKSAVFLFIGLLICTFLFGCSQSIENTNINNSTASAKDIIKAEDNTAVNTDKTFLGYWRINDIIAQGQVSIYSKKDMENIIGTKLYYGANEFKANGKTFIKPTYIEMTVNAEEFASTHYYLTLEALGINTKNILDVTVINADKSMIDCIGSTFLILDNNTLAVYNGGVFFKAVRVPMEE